MAAYDQINLTVTEAPVNTWFKAVQTVANWGTTANMTPGTVYRLRAYDSATSGLVYWTNTGSAPDLSPASTDTTPNFSGTLSGISIL